MHVYKHGSAEQSWKGDDESQRETTYNFKLWTYNSIIPSAMD